MCSLQLTHIRFKVCPEYDPSSNFMQDFPLAFRIGSIPSWTPASFCIFWTVRTHTPSVVVLYRSVHSCWTRTRTWHPHRILSLKHEIKTKPWNHEDKGDSNNNKKNQIVPFLSLKWRIYKYVRVRAVRFWSLTILIQRDSFYTQTFFWFSYFKRKKKSYLITVHETKFSTKL